MASTGIKEYTLRINGVTTSVKDVTKLEDAVKKLDATVKASNASTAAATKATTTKAKALTDEEKAAQRLANTQKRLQQVNSEANKAQIAANVALREATREQTRAIQINQLAEGSVKQMGMQLTDLRNEYEALSAAQREDIAVGGQLLEQIQALDAEYKSLRESTGNFRDSVGNYGRALEGIDTLTKNIEGVSKSTMGLANGLLLSTNLMGMFGAESEDSAKMMQRLQQVIMLVSLAQSVNNDLLKDGIGWLKETFFSTNATTTAIKAKAAAEATATKTTWAARAAQKAFNIVASANPYVLLALALVGVATALYFFATRTDDASEKQERLNELQGLWLDMLEREGDKLKQVGEERVRQLERQLELLEATEGKQADIQALETAIANERLANNAQQRGFYAQELADLDANRKALEGFEAAQRRLNEAKATGAKLGFLSVDTGDGSFMSIDASDIDRAMGIIQDKIDQTNKKIEFAATIVADEEELRHQAEVLAAQQARNNKAAAKAAQDLARQRADIETAAIRDAEDARLRLIQDSYEREHRTIVQNYDRQIEDLRKRLATETELTAKARKEINNTTYLLDLERYQQLDALAAEYQRREAETLREAEDSRIALMLGGLERQRAEINASRDRQIEDLRARLDTEKDLTQAQQDAITQMMMDAETLRARELDAATLENLERRADLQVQGAEAALEAVRSRVGELVGDGLIDPDKVRENVATVNAALGDYVTGLQKYYDELTATHQLAIAQMKEGTVEYEEAMLAYAIATEDVTSRIKAALKEQQDNTEAATDAQGDYWEQLFERIAFYAAAGAEAVTAVTDTIAMGLQLAIDNLNEQLDVVNERFDEAQTRREEAAAHVEQIEERMRNASGATSSALQAQLQDAMAARKDAEREEARLAKEKEKRENEIRKREKQMKRAELVSSIAMGIANTAQAVTKMLTLIWPLNLVMAAVVGAAGAVQVGMMSRQLTKLAKGGPIVGPSHGEGGVEVNVQGKPSYEAEGGEYMINKMSTQANAPLVQFINDAQGPVSLADIAGLVPDNSTPSVVEAVAQSSEDRVVQAIDSIELRPVVQVVDILDVTDQVTDVQDLSGFS